MEVTFDIECPHCGKMTEITADTDAQTVERECQHCRANVHVDVQQMTQEQQEQAVEEEMTDEERLKEIEATTRKAIFTVKIENLGKTIEHSSKMTDFPSIVEGLIAIMDTACLMVLSRDFTPPMIKDLIIRTMIPRLYSPDAMDGLMEFIKNAQTEIRKKELEASAKKAWNNVSKI
jgi:hypothetical protein